MEYPSVLQVRPFRVVVSSDWLETGQLVLVSPHWFCCFSGPGAETQLRPRYYLQGEKPRGGEVTLGARSLFSQFCPQPGTSFHPGDHLHLAVNCLASVFSSLSQFP